MINKNEIVLPLHRGYLSKRRCTELGDATHIKGSITLTVGIQYFTFFIITKNGEEHSCHKRERLELTKHTIVYRCRQLSDMAVTMMLYTLVTLIV